MGGAKARIAVGAGWMGRGLAHVFAYAGHEVALIDVKTAQSRTSKIRPWRREANSNQ